MHFSWGKIWFGRIAPCKIFDISQLCAGVNDRQKGHTDEYTGESVLGTCFLFNLGKPSAIEVISDVARLVITKNALVQRGKRF